MESPILVNPTVGKMSPRGWKKPVFSLAAVLLALGVLEVASRAYLGLRPNARSERGRRHAISIGFPALSELVQADDELFWKCKPNLSKYTVEGRIVNRPMRFSVSTDQSGLRRMAVPDSAERTVLFLGDSCTFGLGVEDEQTFPAVIQSRLPDVRCINAAVSGYTAFQGRVWLEQQPAASRFDVVLIGFGFNDELRWDDLSDLDHYEIIAQERARWLNKSRLCELIHDVLPHKPSQESDGSRPARPRLNNMEFAQEIQKLIRLARMHGAKPILMIWPHAAQVYDNAPSHPKHKILQQIAARENVELVDLTPVFIERRKTVELYLDGIHASPRGCQVVAEALLPMINRNLGEGQKLVHP